MMTLRKTVSVALAIVIALCFMLVGCDSTPKTADVGWLKFDIPQGFQVVNESEYGVAVSTSKDTDVALMKYAGRTIFIGLRDLTGSQHGAADVAAHLLEGDKLSRYDDAGTSQIAGREFHLLDTTFADGEEGVSGFADLNDDMVLSFSLYGMSTEDSDAKTALDSMVIDESKLPAAQE